MERLVLDVGNTKTAVGVFVDGKLAESWRITTFHWTADDLWVIMGSLLGSGGTGLPQAMAFATVVPQVRHSLREFSGRFLEVEPVEVDVETAGVKIKYDYPGEIGADRLANTVGAMKLGGLPAIVVDFGTATTFDAVDASGAFLGGVISPGVGTAAAELFKKAEKLNPVDLRFPDTVIGKSTSHAVRSGVLLGAVGATDYIVRRLISEMEGEPTVWATGGWAEMMTAHCDTGMKLCPELTLVGIDSIGERYGHGK